MILAKILERRLQNPIVDNARLSGDFHECYKIKSKKLGLRLVYQVVEHRLVVLVLSIGPRERNKAYVSALGRFQALPPQE